MTGRETGKGTVTGEGAEADTGQISVAELLARNGQKAATPPGGRRRRGSPGGISVAELTGDIPIVRDTSHAIAEVAEPEVVAEPAPKRKDRRAEDPAPPVLKPEIKEPEAPAAEAVEAKPEPAAEPVAEPAKEPQREQPAAWSSNEREPQLLSGSTVAGDLMRKGAQDRDEAAEKAAEQAAAPAPAPAPVAERATRSSRKAKDKDAAKAERSAAHQWLTLGAQAVVAIVAGALMFKGFERLWDMMPWVALALSFIVIIGLVAVVRVLRKTDDMLSTVIAIVVGLFVTLGPLAFMLSTS